MPTPNNSYPGTLFEGIDAARISAHAPFRPMLFALTVLVLCFVAFAACVLVWWITHDDYQQHDRLSRMQDQDDGA